MWKREMIMNRTRIVAEPPVTILPKEQPVDLIKIKAKGIMQNDDYVLVGPRAAIETGKSHIDLLDGLVYMVFTPFLTENSELLWVNRGQLPVSEVENIAKHLYNWPCHGEIICMVREMGKKARHGKSVGRVFPRFNAEQMWAWYLQENEVDPSVTILPYAADLVDWPSVADQPWLPIGRAPEDYITHQVTPFTHLGYCATWTGSFIFGLYYLRNTSNL
eukprot:gene7865-12084_t